ncbi:MAG: hypothetical protein L6R41_003607 [Letrouitia leprolyta]|nr:MAG: hypothetical protein L6R41_003607 [Letrouitia leprolyta]
MALSDGAHASTEDFSYFTLRRRSSSKNSLTSAFGISCTRQMDASALVNRPADVTRSTVQKAVVVIADSPQLFGHLREKLSMVTGAWFAQRDFTDVDILKKFQESLSINLHNTDNDRDIYLGLSLRELIYEYKYQTLVLFKCCLLQPKMLFFGSRCERLCMMQFSLISLIPGLLRHLEDCADPDFDSYGKTFVPPTSLKTSERSSLLSYMGLPIQIFGKGSLFGPYTPLQQLDVLADHDTRSYIVGSTNSLLLQQKDRYSDILINLDESSITITSPSLRSALALSAADRRWIDFLTQTVTSTWDPQNPSRPNTLAYMGSEEFIRLQFEEYLLALLASVKYHLYLTTNQTISPHHHHHAHLSHHHHPTNDHPSPITDFNPDWLSAWLLTPSYTLFQSTTSPHLFDIVDPKHPTAGNLSIEDVQRRITQQIQTLHLDDRFASTKENLNKTLATGGKKLGTAFGNLWNDIEAFREAQRRKVAEQHNTDINNNSNVAEKTTSDSATMATSPSRSSPASSFSHDKPSTTTTRFSAAAPDLTTAQASVAAAGQRAGAYVSSWGAWAAEKKKGWGSGRGVGSDGVSSGGGSSRAGWISGRGAGWGGGKGPAGVEKGTTGEVISGGGSSGSGVSGPNVVTTDGYAQQAQRSPRKTKSREARGRDGIGRLDA